MRCGSNACAHHNHVPIYCLCRSCSVATASASACRIRLCQPSTRTTSRPTGLIRSSAASSGATERSRRRWTRRTMCGRRRRRRPRPRSHRRQRRHRAPKRLLLHSTAAAVPTVMCMRRPKPARKPRASCTRLHTVDPDDADAPLSVRLPLHATQCNGRQQSCTKALNWGVLVIIRTCMYVRFWCGAHVPARHSHILRTCFFSSTDSLNLWFV